MLSNKTKATVKKIPLLKVRAGPRDKEAWGNRLKEELKAMITYVNNNKENDNDWFFITPNADGTQYAD